MFWYIKHKMLNPVIWNYLNYKKNFKCEIKTASRWQQVTVNKWVIVIEPNHLNSWFIQERNTVMLLRVFGIIFVFEIEQKLKWCLKLKSLNINFFVFEMLNIFFEQKKWHSLCDID